MSALALDEFSLEMRRHYIVTTLESLSRAQSMDDFWEEIAELLPDWVAEARSNDMEFFAKYLELIKKGHETGSYTDVKVIPKIAKTLADYLGFLGTQPDSEGLLSKFSESLEAAGGASIQLYLQCVRHGHHFVVPVANVIEIVGNKKVFPLPLAQAGVQGLMSFRGQGIPVISLNDFGFHISEQGLKEKTSFVVCIHEESFFALEVNSTEDVLEIHPSKFQTCSDSTVLSPAVEKFVNYNEKSLMLLDIKKLVKYE